MSIYCGWSGLRYVNVREREHFGILLAISRSARLSLVKLTRVTGYISPPNSANIVSLEYL